MLDLEVVERPAAVYSHQKVQVCYGCDLGWCCGPAGPQSSHSGAVVWVAIHNAWSCSQCQGLLVSKQETVMEKLKKHMIP